MYRRHLMGLTALLVAGVRTAAALDNPTGTPVLTLTGRVRQPNRGREAVFDMPMLERLPQHTLTAHTPWYAQARRFTGPLLRDVLDAAGADGNRLRAVALNDYAVEIPVQDTRRWNVVLARLLDDKPMSVREKGPLFVIYPFDDETSLRNSVYYSRCAWQLKTIEVA